MKNSIYDRRQFIKHNAAALTGFALAPSFLKGQESNHKMKENNLYKPLGFYHFTLGEIDITILNDGYFYLSEITPPDMHQVEGLAVNVPDEVRREYFESRILTPKAPRLPISPVLVETKHERILIDSGWSIPGASETAGQTGSMLELIGVDVKSIDKVLLTHAHPDHLGGLVDNSIKNVIFPNAEVILAEKEFEFWTGDDALPLLESPALSPIPDILKKLESQLRLIHPDDTVADNIQSIPTPGHTPGHISLALDTGNGKILFTGDALVNIHTSFERPDWHNFWDMDREEAARSRHRILNHATTNDMLIIGFHFPFPGMGYAIRDGDAYRWYPAGTTML
ncbi:MBL fold metallo-hydrolase [Galbibacter sp. EGI 63066]|uniref:MBL fold metallo-hydrolase n=1 Tax=Galbibacter sp. EGI 63066 TaxID=2993559 RepID=UPI002249935A|nr:MBL fold metallo-hydrolase [Galbibacter sp. EGI 63066]MCX2680199.1 MBL fold metallo-hydrolase [Galbibacter sp. EGI 63066]